MLDERGGSSLLCRVLTRLCALPLEHVVETMRPLPVESLAGAPHFVLGVAIIRGQPVPVVGLAQVLAGQESPCGRFVTLRTASRLIALAVDDVIGVRALPAVSGHELPPLLRDTNTDAVASIAAMDGELLMVLQSARLIPDSVWAALGADGEGS